MQMTWKSHTRSTMATILPSEQDAPHSFSFRMGPSPSMAIYFPEIQKIWGNSSTSPPMLAYPAFLGGSTVTGLSSKPMHRFMPRISDEFTYLWFFQICRPISWKSCALFPCFLTSQLCLYTPKKASKPRSRRNQQGPC